MSFYKACGYVLDKTAHKVAKCMIPYKLPHIPPSGTCCQKTTNTLKLSESLLTNNITNLSSIMNA